VDARRGIVTRAYRLTMVTRGGPEQGLMGPMNREAPSRVKEGVMLMGSGLHTPYVVLDSLRVERGGSTGIEDRQERRLRDLVAFARTASPYFRRQYAGLPTGVAQPDRLPPVTKSDLMSHFDEWVTDPAVTLDVLRRDFLADSGRVGERYLGRYHAMTTSGTTGEPAVLLHDQDSWNVMIVMMRLRIRWALRSREVVAALSRRGFRVAALFAGGGHLGANVLVESARHTTPALARRIRLFSVQRPLADLVAELNDFQPTMVNGYPSATALLAGEQAEGRLRISPVLAQVAGEHLTPAMHRLIEEVWPCRVIPSYAASEVPGLAFPCHLGTLHVNADWYVIEPVDELGRPVPRGTVSHSALVTNLANRVQPVIRYDLGDRVRIGTEACPCGSPLPTVTVQGRTDDVLTFESKTGAPVTVLPLAIAALVEGIPGVHRFQLIQTGRTALTVRLEVEPDAEQAVVRAAVDKRVQHFLSEQGAVDVQLVHDASPPEQQPHSGKLRHVYREWS
jgi:phenylacetate-CoA ligase